MQSGCSTIEVDMGGVQVTVADRTPTSLIRSAAGRVWLDQEGLKPEGRIWVPFSAEFTINAPPDFDLGEFTSTIACESE